MGQLAKRGKKRNPVCFDSSAASSVCSAWAACAKLGMLPGAGVGGRGRMPGREAAAQQGPPLPRPEPSQLESGTTVPRPRSALRTEQPSTPLGGQCFPSQLHRMEGGDAADCVDAPAPWVLSTYYVSGLS